MQEVNHSSTGILCSVTKLDFAQVLSHSIITDKRMIAITLIMKVKGSSFLFTICIKEGRIKVRNNGLWHLEQVFLIRVISE